MTTPAPASPCAECGKVHRVLTPEERFWMRADDTGHCFACGVFVCLTERDSIFGHPPRSCGSDAEDHMLFARLAP